MVGMATPARLQLGAEWSSSAAGAAASQEDDGAAAETPEWTSMMRRGSHAARSERPGLFFPIYAAPDGSRILEVGESIPIGTPLPNDRSDMTTIWPRRSDGSDGVWQVGPSELRNRIEQGRVRLGRATAYGFVVNYLPDGAYAAVLSDRFEIIGRAEDGSIIASGRRDTRRIAPSQWKISSHNASEHGTTLLSALLPRRVFPFPKSLYAVEDALRFFVKEKTNAIILDFFSGSGTTAHAVMRLNRQDDGDRQCISVTNNEVAADEQKKLREQGWRPGNAEWEQWGKHAFSLTAVTGAGKTVMAAAAFEALFHGDDEYDFDADHGAVVIWFSDDPALNEQTRFRLMEASDRIRHTDMVVVEHPFSRAKFEAGKIYFLNTQKLGKKSLLVRGFEGDEDLLSDGRPDAQAFTIWDTIRNTIDDPDLTLYLVLDEAHRGMGNLTNAAQSAKSTIVQRLINGVSGVPGIPVVWGISATVERFKKAMEGAQKRTTLPDVVVDSAKVQESGLIKDTIILDIPDDVGDFDTVLVRRATDKLKASTDAWAEYAKQQEDAQLVVPLMVLQVPNTPDPNEIGRALDTIYQQWPDLPSGSVAHVLGEHTTQQYGNRNVPYISPERVQESTWVRVLIAKDAISTGWDCPRAEVMISFRAAVDRTHITQLLGRMVRSPLARRIPGNDRLNSVDCLLPKFDVKTVGEVVDALMKGDDTCPSR